LDEGQKILTGSVVSALVLEASGTISDHNTKVELEEQQKVDNANESFEEQEKSFSTLLSHVKKGYVSLIIIDSIAMLYRLELGSAISSGENQKISEVNRKLARQLRILNEISRKQNIPVIVTNQVYSEFLESLQGEKTEKKISMVGGDLLKYWSKCIIEIQNFSGRRKMILRKHRSIPEKEMPFDIINVGIRKKGLF
jgi:DNA repair protein RadB